MKKQTVRFILPGVMLALLTYGCADTKSSQQAAAAIQQQTASVSVYKGKVIGKSNKAKLLSLEIGNGDEAQIIPIKFDDNTKGIEHAAKGYGAMITYEKRGNKIYAISIKPELAQMPPGVTEISVADVKALIEKKENFELIDSRPAPRFSASHLPGAISLPVSQMQDLLGLLPEDKNKLLVFYCGGPI